jgi:hypothetical protein
VKISRLIVQTKLNELQNQPTLNASTHQIVGTVINMSSQSFGGWVSLFQ